VCLLVCDHHGPVRPHASQRAVLFSGHARRAEVPTRTLKQAVKRNAARFPEDFMFQPSRDEFANLKSQIVTSSWGGLRRATPYAFTEQGVAMLSSVLNSPKAIQVNVEIMRAFVRRTRIWRGRLKSLRSTIIRGVASYDS
jgi:hypothetical protein